MNSNQISIVNFSLFALQEDDFPEDFPCTDDDYIELCEKVPCRIELYSSNVCTAFERKFKSKTMLQKWFGKTHIKQLEPKERRAIDRKMEKHAIRFYNKHVDADRLKKRLLNQKEQALAYYYEVKYRKNVFQRFKAMQNSKDVTHHSADPNESIMVSSCETSLDTVINTGKMAQSQSNYVRETIFDVNDNNCTIESKQHIEDAWTDNMGMIAGSETCNVDSSLEDDDGKCSDSEGGGEDKSENTVSSSEDFEGMVPPDMEFGTPSLHTAARDSQDVVFSDDTEPDTMEFLTQDMNELPTSTQNE